MRTQQRQEEEREDRHAGGYRRDEAQGCGRQHRIVALFDHVRRGARPIPVEQAGHRLDVRRLGAADVVEDPLAEFAGIELEIQARALFFQALAKYSTAHVDLYGCKSG